MFAIKNIFNLYVYRMKFMIDYTDIDTFTHFCENCRNVYDDKHVFHLNIQLLVCADFEWFFIDLFYLYDILVIACINVCAQLSEMCESIRTFISWFSFIEVIFYYVVTDSKFSYSIYVCH